MAGGRVRGTREKLSRLCLARKPIEHERVHRRIGGERKAKTAAAGQDALPRRPNRMSRGDDGWKGDPLKSPNASWMESPEEVNIVAISSRSYPRTRSRYRFRPIVIRLLNERSEGSNQRSMRTLPIGVSCRSFRTSRSSSRTTLRFSSSLAKYPKLVKKLTSPEKFPV